MTNNFLLFLFLLLNVKLILTKDVIISLNGDDWIFMNVKNNSITGKGTVPGDIYTDLWISNVIDDPIMNNNDIKYQWVGRNDWIYVKKINLTTYNKNLLSKKIILNFDGIDTVASVYINDVILFKTENQFLSYSMDVKSYVKDGINTVKLVFESPVNYSKELATVYKARYGHYIPPDCPLPIQHGECHPNFIRKAQASFSWDWGPSFPTVGIWKNSSIIYVVDDVTIKSISPVITYDKNDKKFKITVDVDVYCIPNDRIIFDIMNSLPEINIKNTTKFNVICNNNGINTVTKTINIDENTVELWYPNGYGKQKLYQFLTYLLIENKIEKIDYKKLGFRYIEMIQDFVDESDEKKGRNFYFKINNIPIFLKGSNLIEVENFYGRDTVDRTNFLLNSVKESNMNTLRIWGGGIYEDDYFYSKCDELGILLWHDLPFACALYPINDEFLNNVKNEVNYQVKRLRYHSSILLWAGNNENEVAIMSGWWYVPNYSHEQVIQDYVKLYKTTIEPIIIDLDQSRPYLLSSPSNGIHTIDAGGVDQEPNSEFYGDIHFYNEFINLWKDYNYQTPRCATEYGVQSIPLKDTMLSQVDYDEYFYLSKTMTNRQHHTGGIATLLSMTFLHFDHPKKCDEYSSNLQNCPFVKNDPSFLAPFSYLTQIHQAIAMEVQSTHYRRWMGRYTPDGKGNTMCALYWQLNDVWAGPSWSSIDYNLEWKVLHYRAKNFFAKIIVSMYLDKSDMLQVDIISDSLKNYKNTTLIIEQLSWSNGFGPVATIKKNVDIKNLSVLSVNVVDSFNTNTNNINDYLFVGKLIDNNNNLLTPVSILHPDKFYGIKTFGNVTITEFDKINDKSYSIKIKSTSLAPFVWIDLTSNFKTKNPGILFKFSDNAFTVYQPITEVELIFTNEPNIEPTINDLTVCHLLTCFGSSLNSRAAERPTHATETYTRKLSRNSGNLF